MKILISFFMLLFCAQILAEEKWGEEKFILPTKKNEKVAAFLVRETEYKNKNYKLQAQLLCKYLKENPFIDLVNNKTGSWNHNSVHKSPDSLYIEASKAANKAMESSCNNKNPFYGNILMETWNTFFETCTVKNNECMDFASRYLERADLVSKALFESANFFLAKKGEDSSKSKDCTGAISSESRSHTKVFDHEDSTREASSLSEASQK